MADIHIYIYVYVVGVCKHASVRECVSWVMEKSVLCGLVVRCVNAIEEHVRMAMVACMLWLLP
jgi:hypothetical protein